MTDLDDDNAFAPLSDARRTYKVPRYTCRLVADGHFDVPVKTVGDAQTAADVIGHATEGLPFEQFWAVYLNGRNTILGCELISQGGQHGCAVLPRDVFRGALLAGASAVIVGHCHPSGDPNPSREDLVFTQGLLLAAEVIGIAVLDHVIVARGARAVSLSDRGLGGFPSR
jgi:DNA repair protein RadC